MKKILLSAMLVIGAAATFTSCGEGKKDAATQQDSLVISDSVKAQALELFKSIQSEKTSIMNEIVVTKDGVKEMPVKFFLDTKLADKAQTNYQRSQLLGIYLADKNCNDNSFVGDNDKEARNAAITSLSAALNYKVNLASDSVNVDAEQVNSIALADIEAALDNNVADAALVSATYGIIEATLNKIEVAELLNEYDQQVIFKDILKHKGALADIVALYNLLKPYYKSLEEMGELCTKISAITDAADDAAVDAALAEYVKYCGENRAKIAAY